MSRDYAYSPIMEFIPCLILALLYLPCDITSFGKYLNSYMEPPHQKGAIKKLKFINIYVLFSKYTKYSCIQYVSRANVFKKTKTFLCNTEFS